MTREEMATTVALSAETCREDAVLAKERGDVDTEMWATLKAIALDESAAELRKTCAWTPDEDGTWDSGCYNKCFDTSSPSENQFRFCPFCGGNLEEVK